MIKDHDITIAKKDTLLKRTTDLRLLTCKASMMRE